MNAIDYYRNFIKTVYNESFIKRKRMTNTYIYNNHYLYVFNDKLEGPTKIVTFEDHFSYMEKHVPDERADRISYVIFIPYKGYILTFNVDTFCAEKKHYFDFHLYLYKNDEYIISYASLNIKDIIDFLEIDKLNETLDFMVMTLQIMNHIPLKLKTVGQYNSEYKSLVEKSIDYYIHYTNSNFDNNMYYIIYNNMAKESFLNIENDKCTFCKRERETYNGIIYYFGIDNKRNILVIAKKNQDYLTIAYYNDGKIIHNNIKFHGLHRLLKMILILTNRKDIYEYLEQIQFFKRDIFYSQLNLI